MVTTHPDYLMREGHARLVGLDVNPFQRIITKKETVYTLTVDEEIDVVEGSVEPDESGERNKHDNQENSAAAHGGGLTD